VRHFIFLIGTSDDFESLEDLKNTYFNGGVTDRNMSVFTFDVPSVGTNSLTVHDIATYIGRGLAFSSDWCMDGTLSALLAA
jgi:hypothetical protein